VAESDAVPRPEFRELGRLYNEELAPWLESQEGRRKRARRLRWLIIGFGLAALVAVFFYLATREEEPSGFWFFLLFVAGMGVIVAGNIPIWNLQADAKQFVMGKLAGFFGFTYAAKPEFADFALCKEIDLVPSHTSARFEDGLTGTLKGVPFQLVEAYLTERRGSDKNRRTVTVFRGLLMAFPYPAAIEGRATLWQREQGRWTEGEDWRPVKLDDAAFDETYIVHAADAATARRLLDPALRRAFAGTHQTAPGGGQGGEPRARRRAPAARRGRTDGQLRDRQAQPLVGRGGPRAGDGGPVRDPVRRGGRFPAGAGGGRGAGGQGDARPLTRRCWVMLKPSDVPHAQRGTAASD
jgi:hypothetical protein